MIGAGTVVTKDANDYALIQVIQINKLDGLVNLDISLNFLMERLR